MRCFSGRAFIKSHCDLSAQRGLDVHRNFRRQKTKRAIDMRTKLRSLFSDLAQRSQTPNLKPAGICKHRALPANELVQASARLDRFNPGTQPKMISVSENDPRIEFG